jgi:hypothetical protein
MRTKGPKEEFVLNLRGGEIVEVRSKEEILRTLDENGRLDELPFMPEMLKYCGKRFKVFKRADKSCDTIGNTGCRRMKNTVHLVETRCDGESHGGCEAGCMLFWKEGWLQRADSLTVQPSSERFAEPLRDKKPSCEVDFLIKATRSVADLSLGDRDEVFSCQATQLRKATSYLGRWDYRHYIRDIKFGNRSVYEVLSAIFLELFAKLLKIKGYRALIWTFNTFQRIRGRGSYPYKEGQLKRTPSAALNLRPGELVEVKSHDEILKTVDKNNKNRGLSFDVEMVKYCGGRYRVARKVHKILNEKTGRMMHLPNDCVILEGVICTGDYHQLCPRSIFPYWREIWLRRGDSRSLGGD